MCCIVDLESSESRSRHILHTIDESCYESTLVVMNRARQSVSKQFPEPRYYIRRLLPLWSMPSWQNVAAELPGCNRKIQNSLFVLTLGKYHNIILHMGVSWFGTYLTTNNTIMEGLILLLITELMALTITHRRDESGSVITVWYVWFLIVTVFLFLGEWKII